MHLELLPPDLDGSFPGTIAGATVAGKSGIAPGGASNSKTGLNVGFEIAGSIHPDMLTSEGGNGDEEVWMRRVMQLHKELAAEKVGHVAHHTPRPIWPYL